MGFEIGYVFSINIDFVFLEVSQVFNRLLSISLLDCVYIVRITHSYHYCISFLWFQKSDFSLSTGTDET